VIARRAASVILAGALALGMSGCSFFATQATLIKYQPSDGVAATVGNVEVRNALALSSDGKDASLVLSLVNSGERTIVNFQYTNSDGEKVTEAVVTPSGLSSLGNLTDPKLILTGVDVQLGSLLPVYVQEGTDPGVGMLVPVMDGTLPEYEPLVPTPTPTAVKN